MKLSDAMEAGFAKVGKQSFGEFWGDGTLTIDIYEGKAPKECCAMGAAIYGGPFGHGVTDMWDRTSNDVRLYVTRLNDHCRMPIPEIVEVLRGMGL